MENDEEAELLNSEVPAGWGLKGVFLCEFHKSIGPKVVFQAPDNITSLFNFSRIANYLLPKTELCQLLMSIRVDSVRVLSCPVQIVDTKAYADHRNEVKFNFCFIVGIHSDTIIYRPLVKKIAAYLENSERRLNWFLNDQLRLQVEKLVNVIYKQLSCKGCVEYCPGPGWQCIHMMFSSPGEAKPQVLPSDTVAWVSDVSYKHRLPIDGFSSLSNISNSSDTLLHLSLLQIQDLAYNGRVKILPMFLYSNCYALTETFTRIIRDAILQKVLIDYCYTGSHDDSEKPWSKELAFSLYALLSTGITVDEMCEHYPPIVHGYDERRFIQFSVSNKLLRRIHKYPISTDTESGFDGSLTLDDLCCRRGITPDVFDKFDSDSRIKFCSL